MARPRKNLTEKIAEPPVELEGLDKEFMMESTPETIPAKEAPAAPASSSHSFNVIDVDKDLVFLNKKASVQITDIDPTRIGKGNNTDILVGGDPVEFEVCYGASHIKRRVQRPRTLQDVNPHLQYGWCGVEDMRSNPIFMSGWIPVRRGNEGANGCPESEFNSDGFVKRLDQYCVYTTREGYELANRSSEEKRDARVAGVTGSRVGDHHQDLSQSVEISPV